MRAFYARGPWTAFQMATSNFRNRNSDALRRWRLSTALMSVNRQSVQIKAVWVRAVRTLFFDMRTGRSIFIIWCKPSPEIGMPSNFR